jgi:hypothetical protein
MRNLFLVLVLVNLGFAAWAAWFAGTTTGNDGRGTPVRSITLVSELADAGLEPPAETRTVAASPPEPVVTQPQPAAPAPETSVAIERCTSVGPFQELAQASAAQGELRTAGFEPSQRVVDGEVWVGYWVHLAGIPTREIANEMLERLRASGIADSYIVPGGEESQIISLGVFSEISRAASIREQVRALGYDPTVADRSRRATLYWIDIRAAGDVVIDLEALQPPGRINRLEQRPCPAAR